MPAQRRSERRDTAYSPRVPEEEPSATACEGAMRNLGDRPRETVAVGTECRPYQVDCDFF